MGSRRLAVEITVRFRTLLLIAAATGLAAALVVVRHAVVILFAGAFVALALELPVRSVQHRLHLRRGLAAALVVVGATVALAILLLVLLVPVTESLIDYLKSTPALVEKLRDSRELGWAGGSGAAGDVQNGADRLARVVPAAVGAFLGVAGHAAGTVLALSTIVFFALFVLIDMPRLQRSTASLVSPERRPALLGLWERITETVSRWALGAGFIALIAGTVQGGSAALLGSKHGLALGLIAGLLDVIPTLGATLAGFILVPTLLAEQGLVRAVAMLAVILVYQQLENNILTPTVQGRAVGISGTLVIAGVTLLGSLLGVFGALVAVPVTASLQLVVRECRSGIPAVAPRVTSPG